MNRYIFDQSLDGFTVDVFRCYNSQNTRNYEAIQIINPPIFKLIS